jgi:hypothetical protein
MMVLVVLAGTRMLRGRSSGAGAFAGGALGNFIDVFDPARSRAERDLESREHQGDVLPSPDEDDRAVAVDLDSRTARVRRDRAV